MDINQSDTLQRKSAREEKDERHICPLQLEVIRRCVELWTNPGDIVYDPFGGIGSTSYVALQLGRRAIASELKESYYKQMVANCAQAQVNQDSVQTVGDGILHQLTFFKKIFLFERIVKQNIKKSSNIFLTCVYSNSFNLFMPAFPDNFSKKRSIGPFPHPCRL